MKKKIIIVLSCLLTFIIYPNQVYSAGEITQKLKLKKNYSHLLCFDEKIIRYRTGDNKAFEIEILPDIFNYRHEMLIKPLKKINTNLFVWTKTRIYNFDIESKPGKVSTKFFSFNKDDKELSDELLFVLDGQELDLPPDLTEKEYKEGKKNIEDFEIDLPPALHN